MAEGRGRGRPPKPEGSVPGAARQEVYAASQQRGMAEVGYALMQALDVGAARAAFIGNYKGTASGLRLRRGLGRILGSKVASRVDRELLAAFDALLASGDENE